MVFTVKKNVQLFYIYEIFHYKILGKWLDPSGCETKFRRKDMRVNIRTYTVYFVAVTLNKLLKVCMFSRPCVYGICFSSVCGIFHKFHWEYS